MNKLLWEKSFNKAISLVTFSNETMMLTFDEGDTVTFSTYHDQDCCEHVYGDFSVVKFYEKELTTKRLDKIKVKAVEDMGFLLCFDFGYEATKIFIACYNYQNGYYSSHLDLLVDINGTKTTINISDCVEHHEG